MPFCNTFLGEVYDHIYVNLKAYGNNVEKIFTVNPGGVASAISVKIAGADKLTVKRQGELELSTSLGNVNLTKPIAYQLIDGQWVDVEVSYEVKGDTYGFKVGEYNLAYPLVIDPLLASTYLGGTKSDYIQAMAVDAAGNVYVAGWTMSSDFPTTPGAYTRTLNGTTADMFISKLNSDLTNLIASTYLGGSQGDYAYAITVNSGGNVYVTGYTRSADFPILGGAYATSYASSTNFDTVVAKLDGSLQLVASTLLGGSNDDQAFAIALDANGNVFVGGYTTSLDFKTTPGAYQTSLGINAANTYTVTGLTYGTNYTFQVQASDAVNNWSTDGPSTSLTTPTPPGADTAAPTWQANSSLTVSGVTYTGLTLNWNVAPTDNVQLNGYRIYQNNIMIGTAGKNRTNYSVTGLTQGTTYNFQVQAGDSSNNWTTDGPSTTVTTLTSTDTSAPTWQGNSSLTVSGVTYSGLTLNWTPAADNVAVTGYKVYQGTTLLQSVSAATYSYSVTGLTEGTPYTFQVQAGDAVNNWSTDGPGASVTTLPSTDTSAPTWPTNSSLTASSVTQTGLTLTWTLAQDDVAAMNYRIYQNNKLINIVNGKNAQNIFISKFNNNLSNLLASTLIGSNGNETLHALAIDSSGNVYAVGNSQAPGTTKYPTTTGAYKTVTTKTNYSDGIISKFNNDLTQLLASTYLGGTSNSDDIYGVALDSTGNVYVTGFTAESDFPVSANAAQTTFSGSSGFVSKLNSDLTGLLYSTFFGPSTTTPRAIALDSNGNVFITGSAYTITTTSGAYQTGTTHPGSTTGFVAKFKSDLSTPLLAATYFGGNKYECPYTMALNQAGNVYLAGVTSSTNLPTTTNAVYGTFIGTGTNYDSFIAELSNDLMLAPSDATAPTWPSDSTLTASNVTQTGMTLTWTAATDDVAVTNYKIYQNNSVIGTVYGTTTTYNVTGLTSGTSYTFQVQAGDAVNNWSTGGPGTSVMTIGSGSGSTTGVYTVTPITDSNYTNGKTVDGIDTITVNSAVSGLKNFTVTVNPVTAHQGSEEAVFVQLRGGMQINLNSIEADFDTANIATAGFNVQPGDVVKVYIVDDLTNVTNFNPTILVQ